MIPAQAVSPFAPGAPVFSPVLQPTALPQLRLPEELVSAGEADGRLELPLDELSFHRLTTQAEIAQILHLRDEIQLPASALADPSFHTREKKETSTAS